MKAKLNETYNGYVEVVCPHCGASLKRLTWAEFDRASLIYATWIDDLLEDEQLLHEAEGCRKLLNYR